MGEYTLQEVIHFSLFYSDGDKKDLLKQAFDDLCECNSMTAEDLEVVVESKAPS